MSINCSLWQENSLSVKRFAFAKFSEVPGECFLLFTLILLIFLVSLTGNALITLAICTSPALHTPMYFFLANLSLLEIGYTCSVIPKMLQSLVSEAREISREGCATQMFFFTFFGITDSCWIVKWGAYGHAAVIGHMLPTPLCNTNESWGMCPFGNSFMGNGMYSRVGTNQFYFLVELLWTL